MYINQQIWAGYKVALNPSSMPYPIELGHQVGTSKVELGRHSKPICAIRSGSELSQTRRLRPQPSSQTTTKTQTKRELKPEPELERKPNHTGREQIVQKNIYLFIKMLKFYNNNKSFCVFISFQNFTYNCNIIFFWSRFALCSNFSLSSNQHN